MGWFDLFRDDGWNTYYDERPPVVNVDITQIKVATMATIAAVAILLVVISSRGPERWVTLLRLLINLQTGASILFTVTGQCWQHSAVYSHVHYALMAPADVYAQVGIQVGLKSINVSLTAVENQTTEMGRIDYNERFSYNGVTDMKHDFHDAKLRGLPDVILYVIEYFGVDTGGLRWSRDLRSAGHVVFILLWTSFVSWFVSSILLSFVISRGAALQMLTGALMVLSGLVYHLLQQGPPLILPLQDAYMQLRYGWSFWLCCGSGGVTLASGAGVLVLHLWFPDWTSERLLIGVSLDDQAGLAESSSDAQFEKPGPLQLDTPYMVRKRRAKLHLLYENQAFDHDEITSTDLHQAGDNSHHDGIPTTPIPQETTITANTAAACAFPNGHFQLPEGAIDVHAHSIDGITSNIESGDIIAVGSDDSYTSVSTDYSDSDTESRGSYQRTVLNSGNDNDETVIHLVYEGDSRC